MTVPREIRLSEGQQQCLRLVLAHMNSKEIARALDISPHTVDQRLRQAMRTLDASSRFEAARKYAELAGLDGYQSLIYQPSQLEDIDRSYILDPPARQGKELEDSLPGPATQANAEIRTNALRLGETPPMSRQFPFPSYRGEKNELSRVERLGWISIIAIGGAFSFGGILAGLEALSRLTT